MSEESREPELDFTSITTEMINSMSFQAKLSVFAQYMQYLADNANEAMHKVFNTQAEKHEGAVIMVVQIEMGANLSVQSSCNKAAFNHLMDKLPTISMAFKDDDIVEGKEQNAPSSSSIN